MSLIAVISVNIYETDYQVIENISLGRNKFYSDKKNLLTFWAFRSRNSMKHSYNNKDTICSEKENFLYQNISE